MILIEDGTVIPLDGTRRLLQHTSLAVNDNVIVGVGERSDLIKRFGAPETILNAKGRFVLPGLVNTHTHLFQTLSRGLGMDQNLDGWWRSAIGNVAPNLTLDDVYDAAMVGCIEAIRSGTTTVNDFMYLASKNEMSDRVIKVFDETGIRGILSRGIMDSVEDRAPAMTQNLDEAIRDFERLHKKYDNPNGRLRVWIAPSAFWSTSLRAFEESMHAARELGAMITFHSSESKSVVDFCMKTYGAKDITVLAQRHLLGRDVLAVHCVWLDEEDIQTLARNNVSVSHCPLANMIIADGVAPIREMLKAGVTCSLGTDGAASNNNQDMLGVIKSAALLQKVHYLDPLASSAWKVLEMATIGGAKALGMEGTIGSLKEGYRADIIVVDFRKPHTTPVYDPVANLVYSARPDNVVTVLVDGKVIMKEGVLQGIDEASAVRRLQEDAEKLEKVGAGPLA
ncbi:MAG: amidohydrolase [Thaumarchaeota archaeon]|nr:amidohydrolase [Nitrososphaerota archaeon]